MQFWISFLFLVLSFPLFLGGCGSTHRIEMGVDSPSDVPLYAKRGTYKIGKPYEIKGKMYYPKENFEYDETGLASWYGPGFHGKTTANMEIFDQNQISAAHKTLQLPCLVRVYNLENGRILDVRINDRGPYYDGRIIDLSKRAAQLLDIFRKGTAKVRVKVLKKESLALKNMALGKTKSPLPPPNPPQKIPIVETSKVVSFPTAAKPSKIYITLPEAKYRTAAKTAATLDGLGPVVLNETRKGDSIIYEIKMGPFSSEKQAQEVLKKIHSKGFSTAKILATT